MTILGAVNAQAANYVNIVVANGIVARIRTGGSHGSLYAREAKISQRITNALGSELTAIFPHNNDNKSRVKVAKSGGLYTLSIGNTMLIQVYPEDASGAGTTIKTLAYQWKSNFAARLPMAVSPSKVPAWYEGPAGGGLPTEPVQSGLPPQDAPLVLAVVRELSKIRGMSQTQFDQQAQQLEAGMLAMVVGYRQAQVRDNPPTSFLRVKSLFTVVRGTGMSNEKFAINKNMYAGTTIKKVREKFKTPARTGAIPTAAQVVMPAIGVPVPPTDVRPIDAPRVTPGTPVAKAILGSGLDPDNHLINPGQQFAEDVPQVLLYLQIKNSPNNTPFNVAMRMGEQIIGKKRMNISGDRTLAVTFYPQTADRFTPGDYVCEITAADQTAVVIPFRVGD